MSYNKNTWQSGDTVTSAKLNHLEDGVEQAHLRVVADTDELLSTTEDKVLVLQDNLKFGSGGSCIFAVREGETYDGYQRTDGTYVYPVADQVTLPQTDPPVEEITGCLKTWLDNEHFRHCPASTADTHNLFENDVIQDSDGYYTGDCSSFVSSVLLGITYNNSRYVLGSEADNIYGEYIGENLFPKTNSTTVRKKGGLCCAEMAIWYAHQKRLFTVPSDPKKAAQMLQFGDILFMSDAQEVPTKFYNIAHLGIVLGTIPATGRLILAECVDLNVRDSYHEQNGAITSMWQLATYIDRGLLKVFARPNYAKIEHPAIIIPNIDGTFKYNCRFLASSSVYRGVALDGSIADAIPGHLVQDSYFCATPDYYPAISGSTIAYTGSLLADKGKTLCRVHEYNDAHELINNKTILYYDGSTPAYSNLTVGSSTKYLRFSFGFSNAVQYGICLKDSDAFEVTVTPPSSS